MSNPEGEPRTHAELSKVSGDYAFKVEGEVTGGTDNIIRMLEDAIFWIREGKRREKGDAHFGNARLSIRQIRPPRDGVQVWSYERPSDEIVPIPPIQRQPEDFGAPEPTLFPKRKNG